MKKADNYEEMIVVRYIESLLTHDSEKPSEITTQQIQDNVSEMAEIEINHIAKIMFDCGFEVGRGSDGNPCWIIK